MSLQERYIKLKTKRDLIKNDIRKLKSSLLDQKEVYEKHVKARWVLAEVALQTQIKFKKKVEALVTSAIRSVFDRDFKFSLIFEQKRNKMECRPVILEDGFEFDPEYDKGGGLIDIISFALRIVLWSLEKPRSRNTFILDEPFSNGLGDELYIKAGQMLKELSKKLKLQIIMITYNPAFIEVCDRGWNVDYKNKRSVIKRIK